MGTERVSFQPTNATSRLELFRCVQSSYLVSGHLAHTGRTVTTQRVQRLSVVSLDRPTTGHTEGTTLVRTSSRAERATPHRG
jgi:hypothetical protein